MLTYKSHGLLLGQGARQRRGLSPACALERVLIPGQREREGLAWAGTRRRKQQAAGRGSRGSAGKKRQESTDTVAVNDGRRPLGGRTDDLTGLRAATLPSPTRKTGLEMKKEAETRFMSCQRFAAAAGPGSHVHTAMLSSRARAAWGTVQKTDRSPRRSLCQRCRRT